MANDTAQPHGAHLPVELIVRIGEFLAGDLCFGVLVNLNVACRTVHEETRSILYHTMFLRYTKNLVAMFKTPPAKRPPGWDCVRYLIVEDIPVQRETTEEMSQPLGDTTRLPSIFPSLRLALLEFDHVMGPYYPFIGCHAILFQPIRQSTLVSMMLSTTAARHYYFDKGNPLLAVAKLGPGHKRSCHYIPSKISRMLLHREGTILPEPEKALQDDVTNAWDAIAWDFRLFLHASNAEREDPSLPDVLVCISEYLFPASTAEHYADGRHKLQISCEYGLIPHVMALSGALPSATSISVGVIREWLHVAEFVENVKEGAKQYFVKRKAYLESLPADKRQQEQDFFTNASDLHYFPEIKRRGIRTERMFIEVNLLAEYGEPMPEEDGWLEDDGLLDDERLVQVWVLMSKGPKSARSWDKNELIVGWDYNIPVEERDLNWPAMLCKEE